MPGGKVEVMEASEVRRAVDAARTIAVRLGLPVDAAVVVHDSDRIAVRLSPCGVLARVAPSSWYEGMGFEVAVARRLAEVGAPVGVPDPRVEAGVHVRDGFAVTLWTYYEHRRGGAVDEQLGMSSTLAPAEYARALARLHAALRRIELAAPPIAVRIADWTASVGDPQATPDLPEPDRVLLGDTLRRVGAAVDGSGSGTQLVHGEPHPGNVLDTAAGPLFVDVGTCQRGPVEYDLAYAPDDVAVHYPGADLELVRRFRILMWAGVAAMRWHRDDQYPDRDHWRAETLRRLRAALGRR